jgi:hypothetical protein
MECAGEGQQQFNCPTEQMGLYTKVDWPTDRRSSRDFDFDRRSVSLYVLISNPIWGQRPNFCYCQTVMGLFVWGAHSDKRTDLSFTPAFGHRQRSYSWVRVRRPNYAPPPT